MRDGVLATTDGPFAEAKEQFAGYVSVDVASEERAIEIGGGLAVHRALATEGARGRWGRADDGGERAPRARRADNPALAARRALRTAMSVRRARAAGVVRRARSRRCCATLCAPGPLPRWCGATGGASFDEREEALQEALFAASLRRLCDGSCLLPSGWLIMSCSRAVDVARSEGCSRPAATSPTSRKPEAPP